MVETEAPTSRRWGLLMWELREAIDYRLKEGREDKNFGEYATALAGRIKREKEKIKRMEQN